MANECALDTVLVRRRLAELGLSQRAFAQELDFDLDPFEAKLWQAEQEED